MDITPLYTSEMKAEIKSQITKDVGKKVEELRKKKGLSQRELGFLIESNKQNIYKIEAGLYCPTIATLYYLAEALSCEISDFLPKIAKSK